MGNLSKALKSELRTQKLEREQLAIDGAFSPGGVWDEVDGEDTDLDDVIQEEAMEGLLHCPDYQFGPECKVTYRLSLPHLISQLRVLINQRAIVSHGSLTMCGFKPTGTSLHIAGVSAMARLSTQDTTAVLTPRSSLVSQSRA